ncbi:MAG TPA: hypothetical protein VLZ81_08705 [Blastocatellia bacterium]|nr:hypothetical protein [Blastocatellia bacterium]
MPTRSLVPETGGDLEEGEIKGVQIRAAYMFLKQRYGDQAVEEALKSASSEDRLIMPSLLLDSNWYPHTAWRVIRRITRVLDPNAGRDFPVEMGKFMADYVFKGVYKSLLSPDPSKQVEKFKWIHDLFYRDVCTLDAKAVGTNSGVVSYSYRKGVTVTGATCLLLMGFWTRTLELAGAKDVEATHPKCVSKGSPVCEYSFTWK